MWINKDSLKARANNISKELGISQNLVYYRFFFDAFLSRLAKSNYKNQLILKGGLYLSSLLGVENRHTVDIDFHLKQLKLEQDTVVSVVKEICGIDTNDGIIFKILGINNIRTDDKYGGFQIDLEAKLDNVKNVFSIDIATGDPITPNEELYNYTCLVSKETLNLKTYSLETIVAEKLETVISRGITNSRSKDYYDLYLLAKTQIGKINLVTLRKAFKETCKYREASFTKSKANEMILEIMNNDILKKRWESYSSKNLLPMNIDFKDVCEVIRYWIEAVFPS